MSGLALALLGAQLGVQALGHRAAPDMEVAAICYAATGQPVFPLYGIADGRCTRYPWSNGREIALAPAWIIRLLTPLAPVPFTPRAVSGSASDAALVATVAAQPEGNRNNYLHWAACRVYERGGDPAVLEALVAAAVAGGQLESKARATVASAGRNVGAS